MLYERRVIGAELCAILGRKVSFVYPIPAQRVESSLRNWKEMFNVDNSVLCPLFYLIERR